MQFLWLFSLHVLKSKTSLAVIRINTFPSFYTGSPGTSSAKRHISSKGVVVILIFCVVLTTIAFLASIACYFYRKDKFSGKPPILSSDKETSWNSRTNLISQRSASFPGYQVKVKSHFNPIAGNILISCQVSRKVIENYEILRHIHPSSEGFSGRWGFDLINSPILCVKA